jgi:hypothetical protein
MRTRAILTSATLCVSAACLVSTPAPADLACQARATSSLTRTVDFEALHAYGTGATGFHWDFGDGTSSTEQNPSHTYPAGSNIYRAILTVTDAGLPQMACRDTVEVPINIIIDRTCWGTASTRWGDAPLGVQFDGRGQNFPDPPPYRCEWTFGDGTTSDLCAPFHAYSPGTYWAVFTLHTSIRGYQCSTLRITALDVPTPVRQARWGRLKQLYR